MYVFTTKLFLHLSFGLVFFTQQTFKIYQQVFGLSLAYPFWKSNPPFCIVNTIFQSKNSVPSLLSFFGSSSLLCVSLIMSLCLPWSPPLYQSCVALLVTAIISTLCPPSLCQPSRLTCVPVLGTRRHAYLVSPVLMTTIISTLFPSSLRPLSCLHCVSAIVPAIMSTCVPVLVPAII